MIRFVTGFVVTALLVSAAPTQTKPDNHYPRLTKDLDCKGKHEGVWVIQRHTCTPFFYKCSNDRAFKYSCPSGLFYDEEVNRCHYKREVPACGGVRPTQPPHIQQSQSPQSPQVRKISYNYGAPVAPAAPAPVNVQPAAPGYGPVPVTAGPAPVNVQPAAPGYGPIPATTGPAPVNVQPAAPAYGQPATAAPAPVAVQTTPAPYYVIPPAPVQTTTRAPVDYNCAGKSNGFYSKQVCGPNFYYCNGGIASQITCPPGTGYDPVSHACEWLSECGKPKTTTTTAAPAPVNVQPPTTQSTECQGKPDGYYPKGTCQTGYLLCSNGFAYSQSCPASLVFNNGTCVYLSDCLNPTTTAAPAPVNVQPPAPVNPYAVQTTAPPAPINVQPPAPVNPYQVQTTAPPAPVNVQPTVPVTQAPYYAQTTPAQAPVNVQPPAPVNPYQVQTTAAPAPVNVQPPAPVNPYQVQTTAAPAPINIQPSTTAAPAFDCSGKQDGYYTSKVCGPVFYTCVGGVTFESTCPPGTGYDVISNNCEWLSECGKPKPTTTTAAPAPVNVQPPAPGNPYAPVAPVNVQPTIPAVPATAQPTSPAPVNFDCSSKQDGYYGQGCSANYFSCAAGSAYAFTCPQGLLFSTQAGYCDYQANIPECGGQLPTTTTAAPAPVNVQPTVPVQPSQPVPYAPGPVQPLPGVIQPTTTVAPESNLCANLQNGIYGRRCSRHYFVCSDNRTYEFTCPINYVYDPKSSQCAPKEVVDICQPTTTTTTTVAPPPVNVQPTQPAQAYNPYAAPSY